MPDKPLTIATYAAGASLAAITLVYVFGPTFFIDGEASSPGSKTKGVVGLSNPANDCFINSVLQSLAGLEELRIYLIRESHRRRLDGPEVYKVSEKEAEKLRRPEILKAEGLQKGIVTTGLKEVLDNLNERPIYKKTISAAGFVEALETAFRQKISRQQQDAQEFLQVVVERVCDEYHAGCKAREKWQERQSIANLPSTKEMALDTEASQSMEQTADGHAELAEEKTETNIKVLASTVSEDLKQTVTEEGFPFEGKLESQVECLTCHFKPKPSVSRFVTLTLNVPQRNSATLNQCFDGFFQLEHIDDYLCDRCRLVDAMSRQRSMMEDSQDLKHSESVRSNLAKIQHAIDTDPESPPNDVKLPDTKDVPKRRISRHVRITNFPKILAIHLSRSIFDPRSSSMKNSAKVVFSETLSLGGLLNPKSYKLLGIVTHKGSHNSGHYESYRRQDHHPPFSTPNVFQHGGAYGQTKGTSTAMSPSLRPSPPPAEPGSKKKNDRWWRISDERVKVVSSGEVYKRGDVYLLFYALVQ